MRKSIFKLFGLILLLVLISINVTVLMKNTSSVKLITAEFLKTAVAQDDPEVADVDYAYKDQLEKTTSKDYEFAMSDGTRCSDHVEISIITCTGTGTMACEPGCLFYTEVYCSDGYHVFNSGDC